MAFTSIDTFQKHGATPKPAKPMTLDVEVNGFCQLSLLIARVYSYRISKRWQRWDWR